MSQIFSRRANTIARASLIIAGLIVVGAVLFWAWFIHNTTYATRTGIVYDQPVPFSHEIHAGDLAVDCRYCHTSVEQSAFAGMPSSATCMACHSQVWTDVESIIPVESSYESGYPLAWNRVHDLPDFTYFDHSIHVNSGVGCESCHGRVDEMPLVWQVESLSMAWCLDCHRNPENHLRPVDEVFTMGWQPPADQRVIGQSLVEKHNINVDRLDDCNVCHR